MAGKSNLSADKQHQIAAAYAAGARSSEVAHRFGIDRSTVTSVVRRLGGTVRDQGAAGGRRPYRRFTKREIATMARLWHRGVSQNALAQKYKSTQTIISKVLMGAGIAQPARPMAIRRGALNNNWGGGRSKNGYGYWLVFLAPEDPFAVMRNRSGYVLEHRLVMARALGRVLSKHETVHHINGNVADNRPENLQLRQGRHGKGIRHVCADCGSSNVIAAPLHENK